MASAGACPPSSRSRPSCSVGTALLIALGSKEVRPEVVPTGRIVDLAFASLRGVVTDPATRRIFGIFGISFVAIQMSRPYIPVLVEQVAGAVRASRPPSRSWRGPRRSWAPSRRRSAA